MTGVSRRHPSEALLDAYVRRRLAAKALPRLEEHLLLCSRCSDRVRELEEFVRALRHSLSEPEDSP